MSKDFNEEKTFVDNYDLDFNFMETFQDEKKYFTYENNK